MNKLSTDPMEFSAPERERVSIMPKNKKNSLVSLIIINRNHAQFTLECLRAVEKTKYSNCEIVLVDNGSSDKELEVLEKKRVNSKRYPINLIKLSQNQGFARAGNVGAKAARGEFLVFLNNDALVTPNWLMPLVDLLESDPLIAVCQPKLRSNVSKEYFDYAGGAGGFLDMFGYPYTRGRVFDSIEKDRGQYDNGCEISWACGACMAIKRDVFWQLNGFDEYFFAYYEEIDLCVRIKRKGYKILYCPNSLVYHYGSATANENLTYKTYLNHHNNLYFVIKNYSVWPYFPIILARMSFDLVSVFYYMSQLRPEFVRALIFAYLKLVFDIPKLINNNALRSGRRNLLFDKTVSRDSVVFNYFIRRQKTYHQLEKNDIRARADYKRYSEVTYFN